MQSQTSKILLSILITAVLVGGGVYYWQNQTTTLEAPEALGPINNNSSKKEDLREYSGSKYSFTYPQDYVVTPERNDFKALTIKKTENARLEIFQMKDFGDRPLGFDGTETQADIDGYIPKETLTVGSGDKKYDVWLFYSANDAAIKEDLRQIFESIRLK